MIKNRETANSVIDAITEVLGILDSTVQQVKDSCPHDEFVTYRKGVGHAMAALYEISKSIHNQHPGIMPNHFD